MNSNTRQLFEQWFFEGAITKAAERNADGEYKYMPACQAWKAWQAAVETEREALHSTMITLLDILRRWEPSDSIDTDSAEILRAMYQIGVLRDPTETVSAMEVGGGRWLRSERTRLKIFQMNDCDWLIGESLEACKAEYIRNYSDDPDSIDEDAHELSDDELDTLKFSDRSEDDQEETTRTFREQLATEISKGGLYPRMFASTEN